MKKEENREDKLEKKLLNSENKNPGDDYIDIYWDEWRDDQDKI